jgi:hypothetical protein
LSTQNWPTNLSRELYVNLPSKHQSSNLIPYFDSHKHML